VTEQCGSWDLVAVTDDVGAVLSVMEAQRCPHAATTEVSSACDACGRVVEAACCDDHVGSDGPAPCFYCDAQASRVTGARLLS
jgi:hypothetical protein